MRIKLHSPSATTLLTWAMFTIYLSNAIPRGHPTPELNNEVHIRVNPTEGPSPEGWLPAIPEGHRWKFARTMPTCRVGFYGHKVDFWAIHVAVFIETTPLSLSELHPHDPTLYGRCYKLKSVAPWMPSSKPDIKALFVQGYCTCVFYADENCGRRLFDVQNRFLTETPPEIGIPSPDPAYSFGCAENIGFHDFSGCSINISNGGDDEKRYNEWDGVNQTVKFSAELKHKDISPVTGQGKCTAITIDGVEGLSMRSWVVSMCTCHFYTDSECKKRLITDGNRGTREVKQFQGAGLQQKIRSFRCDLPWSAFLLRELKYLNQTEIEYWKESAEWFEGQEKYQWMWRGGPPAGLPLEGPDYESVPNPEMNK
ncbi:hypothetical protein TWF730_003309 [Orbilia blumenaviensis]|uniref:Uncharacterized protein n=1 Tax=Orbilia blumenaviensis TaxID=1796055 RepID=A0AAV9U5K0_9PEZI